MFTETAERVFEGQVIEAIDDLEDLSWCLQELTKHLRHNHLKMRNDRAKEVEKDWSPITIYL